MSATPGAAPETMTIYRPYTQRIRDAASLLPAVGIFLLMPPVITLFVAPWHVLGVPLIVAYLFGVWLALIGCSAWFAHRLAPMPPEPAPAQPRAGASSHASTGDGSAGHQHDDPPDANQPDAGLREPG